MMVENYQGKRFMEPGYPIFGKIVEISGIDEMNSLGRKRSLSAVQFLPTLFVTIAVYPFHVPAIYMDDIPI